MSECVTIETPAQWTDLLKRHPEYRPIGTPPVEVALTPERHAELYEVHNDIAATCPWRHDFFVHGALDFWAPATSVGGDCEDLALAKMPPLIARGWDPASFCLILCKGRHGRFDETEFDHAVCGVFTDRGLVISDNRMRAPAAMPDLGRDLSYLSGYRWLCRSDPRGDWISLEEGLGLEETQVLNPDIRGLNREWDRRLYARHRSTA